MSTTTADEQLLRETLDALFGDTTGGYLHIAVGRDPYLNDSGKYRHRDWQQTCYQYPAETDQAVAHMLSAAPDADVYVCTSVMLGRTRTKGAAAERTRPHADIDHGHLDPGQVAAIGGWAISSGTPGHGHVYAETTEPLTVTEYDILCRALGDYLGGADSKISDNDVLRPAGTFSQKPTIAGGDPAPVRWLVTPSGVRHAKHALAYQLGVTLPEPGAEPWRTSTHGATTNGQHRPVGGASTATEPFDLDDYPLVAAALAKNTGDRSVDSHRVVAACVDADLSLEQTRWAVRTRADLAERLDERKDDDVQTSWDKIHADRQARIHETAEPEWPADDPGADEPPNGDPGHITHSAHLGMAIKLAKQFTDKLLYVNKVGWHRWDVKRWAPDGDGAARRAVHTVIRRERAKCAHLPIEEKEQRAKQLARYETAGAITGILTEAAVLEVFSVTVADLDADPWLLNCANGTLDLHTLQLRPASPADRITKVCRGAYHPDATAPVWDAFLTQVLPDEQVRSFVARLTGLALLGEVREHILPIFTGTGANGKGTFYKAVLYELDDYGCTAEADLFTHRENAHPTGQMDLLGRRFVVVSETDEGKRLAEATMKRLTGGDPITARLMRQDNVTFTPSHLPILVTNHLPKVSGDDPAIWRRIRVVPWSVVIADADQDKALDAKLQLEADGILSWAVEGLRDYLAGGLAEPDSVVKATAAYKTNSDAVARFIEEECHRAAAVKISAGELFDGWDRWRKIDGAEEISKKALGQALSRLGFTSSDSNGKRWWHGICILKTEEQ